ncbi:hypothetical protein [Gilvibacter sediminis]|uniref:hypothetical protein n=1 Tax=Gilvibacter sediminis TaxID=379071 RepID=UPI00234FC34E|nr:hypothetical protein [Gilvibacter sediminis]MDC7998431.1 hypothetical protein [Gilvibacter sediminis]
MKKIGLSIITFATAITTHAQVGINTNDPQQTLDIGGAAATVMIDGLNSTNNTTNLGAGLTTRVYVDSNGDLVLDDDGKVGLELLVDAENYLVDAETSDNRINQVGTAFGYELAGEPNDFASAQFTLTNNAIVEVNYSVSWSIYKTRTPAADNRIQDGQARIIQTGVYFRRVTDPTDPYAGPAITYELDDPTGTPINGGPWCISMNSSGTTCLEYGGLLALNGQFYTNTDQDDGAYRNFKNTGSDYVRLGPGTYVALFVGRVYVGDVASVGAIKAFLGSDNDELQIIAHYYE